VPILPKGFGYQSQIASAVKKAEKALAPDVVRIRHNLGEDWSGDPAIFFRIVLLNRASREAQLWKTTERVTNTILKEVKPDELDLLAYFDFRNVSEQAELKEESWA